MGAIFGGPGFRGACSTWRTGTRDRKPQSRQWTGLWPLHPPQLPRELCVPHSPPWPWANCKVFATNVRKLMPVAIPQTLPSRFYSAVMDANMNGRMASRSGEIFRVRTEQNQQLCVIEAHSLDLIRAPSRSRVTSRRNRAETFVEICDFAWDGTRTLLRPPCPQLVQSRHGLRSRRRATDFMPSSGDLPSLHPTLGCGASATVRVIINLLPEPSSRARATNPSRNHQRVGPTHHVQQCRNDVACGGATWGSTRTTSLGSVPECD